ncbi:PHP C-terminal domain protein [Alkaliphilus metalliredigens QYMF]|uniref:DNA polymerase beta n=1 Tax=Alkaliphilus metalliredigens (strain QYMF) TaxID=293826 RepID=A6TSY7_ALKMQ|nr:DNA polymerase/3'-5' exonuclease PolX [Alkaliphilus metalliredigens]ABR49305.1 PHP C-terminal domain protein [Alkaliphilus metalliredigens QYMF]
MDKKEIANILEEIGMLLELKGENPFKVRAYYNGARALELLEEDIEELVNSGEIHKVKGIGKALAEKITELVQEGHLAYYEALKDETPEGLFEILKVPGIGPKKVKELYEKRSITTLGELEYACLENRLIDLKGFGEKTQNKILSGIDHIKKHRGQHLVSTALTLGNQLLRELQQHSRMIKVSLAGSIRRRKEIVKDIDIIGCCLEQDREDIMAFFTSLTGVTDVIAQGKTKSSVSLDMGINVDLRVVDESEYASALHHFTGSKDHNTALRHRAKTMGLKVNEYGVFKGEERLPIQDEKALFDVLKLSYIPPELREGMGEIEAAEAGRIPNLVERKEIKGVFHVHSHYSDGVNSIEEIVQAAIKEGFQYIGISDHSQTAFYAKGLKVEQVQKQHQEIEVLREEYPEITILKGIESDILPDGSLDYEDEVLASFDYVIGSVHSQFNMEEEIMTKRIIKAIENKYLRILGHPTGRLLLSRKSYPVNLEKIIEACAVNDVAIEINSNPHRLDLDWRMCRYAKEQGVKLVIEPDAHRTSGIDDVQYGVGIARKGWLEPKDIINTKPVEVVLDYFKRGSHS